MSARRAPLRPLRRPVRPRDADARRWPSSSRPGARRASDAGLPRRARRLLLRDYAGRPTPLYLARRLSEAAGRRSTSSARTSTTPARTRSTTPSARRCWPSAWASRGSSPRPAPASTASPRPPPARCSASSAWSTWAPRTCAASAQRPAHGAARRDGLARSRRARARSRRRSARRSATGSPTSRRHALHHRLVRRAGAVPGARARPPARDRRRGARADPRGRGPPARRA